MITQKTKQLGGQLVNRAHVNELIRNYKKFRWAQNSARIGKEDSLSTWYNLASLEKFLQLARENNADGVKMYFGVYPENFSKKPEYGGRQTVVLVATKEKINEQGRVVNKEVYYNNGSQPEILAFNISTICPPDCGSGLPGEGDYGGLGITIFQNDDQLRVI